MTSLTPNQDAVRRMSEEARQIVEGRYAPGTCEREIADLTRDVQDAVLLYLARKVDEDSDVAVAMDVVAMAWANTVTTVAHNFAYGNTPRIVVRELCIRIAQGIARTLEKEPDIKTSAMAVQPGRS